MRNYHPQATTLLKSTRSRPRCSCCTRTRTTMSGKAALTPGASNNSKFGSNVPQTETTTPRGRVVVLNGFPGVGKLTILKRTQRLLHGVTTCLLDNHLLIDPVMAVIPDRSKSHHELRREIRKPIFEALRQRLLAGHTILMTACLADNNETDAAVLHEHLDIVAGTDCALYWVNLTCVWAELERRATSPGRCTGDKTKLTDVAVLSSIVQNNRLIDPLSARDPPPGLVVETLDVSGNIDTSVERLLRIIG